MKFLNKFNITINNEDLLWEAVTHKSYSNENNTKNYERLEFLGDSILNMIVSEYLIENYNLEEGDMSKVRATYVCENALCEYAKVVGYVPYIRLGKGLMHDLKPSIIADVFEAVVAVIYLEHGFDVAKKYIYEVVIPAIVAEKHFYTDYKTALQEMVHTNKKSLEYVVVNEEGPAHDRIFTVDVIVDGIVFGTGVGKSKKDAEQKAAYDAFSKQAK